MRLQRIQLIRKWGQYGSGRYLDTQPNMAALLIRQGLALDASPQERKEDNRPIPRKAKRK